MQCTWFLDQSRIYGGPWLPFKSSNNYLGIMSQGPIPRGSRIYAFPRPFPRTTLSVTTTEWSSVGLVLRHRGIMRGRYLGRLYSVVSDLMSQRARMAGSLRHSRTFVAWKVEILCKPPPHRLHPLHRLRRITMPKKPLTTTSSLTARRLQPPCWQSPTWLTI